MMRNVSEHGERVVVNGWWCRVLVPGGGVGWCRVPLSGGGAQAPAFGAQRSMSVVRPLVF